MESDGDYLARTRACPHGPLVFRDSHDRFACPTGECGKAVTMEVLARFWGGRGYQETTGAVVVEHA